MTKWAVLTVGNRKGAEAGASITCSSDSSADPEPFFLVSEHAEKGARAFAIFNAEMLHDLDKNSMGSNGVSGGPNAVS